MKKVIISLLIVLVIGIVVGGTGFALSSANSEDLTQIFGEHYTEKNIAEDNAVTTLNIDMSADKVSIVNADDGKLSIKYFESEKTKCEYSFNETTSTATFKTQYVFSIDNLFRFGFTEKPTVEIKVPTSVTDLYIKLGSGSLEVDTIINNFTKVDVNLSSGELKLANLTADQLNVSVGSGKAEIEEITAGNAVINLSSGAFISNDCIFTRAQINISSGSAEFNDFDSDNATCSISSGSVTFGLSNQNDYKIRGTASSGEVEIFENGTKVTEGNNITFGSGSKVLSISVSSGIAKIKFAT